MKGHRDLNSLANGLALDQTTHRLKRLGGVNLDGAVAKGDGSGHRVGGREDGVRGYPPSVNSGWPSLMRSVRIMWLALNPSSSAVKHNCDLRREQQRRSSGPLSPR